MTNTFFFPVRKATDLLQLQEALAALHYTSTAAGLDKKERPLFRLYSTEGKRIGVVVLLHRGSLHQATALIEENLK